MLRASPVETYELVADVIQVRPLLSGPQAGRGAEQVAEETKPHA